MSDNQHEQPRPSDPPADQRQPPSASEEARRKEAHRRARRQLFRAGLLAVPAMLTLRARPALAQQNPSGTVSTLPDYGQKGHWECSGGYWHWTGYIDPNLDPQYPEEKHWDGVDPPPTLWDPAVIYEGGDCVSGGSLDGAGSDGLAGGNWLAGGDAGCCGDEW